MRLVILVAAGAFAVLLSGPAGTQAASPFCTDGSREFACGNILVILEPDADGIAPVIERNGGQASDLHHTFRGMGGPTGDDVYYVVTVAVGTEVDAAERYSTDPDVWAAMVNQEEIGSWSGSNTAMPAPTPPWRALSWVGAALVGLAVLGALEMRNRTRLGHARWRRGLRQR